MPKTKLERLLFQVHINKEFWFYENRGSIDIYGTLHGITGFVVRIPKRKLLSRMTSDNAGRKP